MQSAGRLQVPAGLLYNFWALICLPDGSVLFVLRMRIPGHGFRGKRRCLTVEEKNIIMDENAVGRALTRITYEILEHNRGAQEICLVGILSRGAVLAGRIAERIRALEGIQVDCGVLDITAYRDDVPPPENAADRTQIPFSTRDRHVVLCDDVLYTGRTARAAMDAVIRHGRPRSVQLAVLVDRGHREVPIRPDYVGKNLPTARSETVRVSVREIDGEDRVSIWQPDGSGGEE